MNPLSSKPTAENTVPYRSSEKKTREKTGINLKPKDLRDFFSQEMGKALIPDRYIDIFQGRAPRNVLAKHYTPQETRLLREIYDKANLKVLK